MRTAAVGGQRRALNMAFRKRVEVAAETGLEIEFFEPLQKVLAILGPPRDQRAERKVRKNDQRFFLVEPGQFGVEPVQSRLADGRIAGILTGTGIEADELPVA